jgi:hypothetical protein
VRRGLAFFAIVTAAFAAGVALHGEIVRPDGEHPLRLLGALTVAATGALDAAAFRLGLGVGAIRSGTYEYGTTFLLTAGLMNALLVLDAVDVALGRKP